MKLVPPGKSIPWWQAHPEHGFDWNAYRKLEERMIKAGELKELSHLHEALDEDELMRAYDARAMDDLERKIRADRAKASPIREAGRSAAPSAREILKDPRFAPAKPGQWRGVGSGLALGGLLGLFDKQTEMARMGEDSWDPKYAEPGVDTTPEVFRAVGNAYSRVRGRK